MIITRTPFRISFAGGGTDLPSFYKNEPGCVLSTSIDKYMFIAMHPFFDPEQIQLKYSKTELVNEHKDISHPILREVLKQYQLKGVDINSIADVPAGTGLGSSSSFTVGLLHTVNTYLGQKVSADKLAAEASDIEINKLKDPIGKQDQYAAAYGGLNLITFNPNGSVQVEKIEMDKKKQNELAENLIMIYTGDTRSASKILKVQNENTNQKATLENLRKMSELARELKAALDKNQLDSFGEILNAGWELKRSLVKEISNTNVDALYTAGLKAGALGGKLLGAGGGGFLLFYCPKEQQDKFRKTMAKYRELLFDFDNDGSKVIYIGEHDVNYRSIKK
ncbi:GHMP kinase [Candidatus Margulisiibacteriota bacterium]